MDKTQLSFFKKKKSFLFFQAVFLNQKTLVGQTKRTHHKKPVSFPITTLCRYTWPLPVILSLCRGLLFVLARGRLADTAATSQEWEVEKCCRCLENTSSPLCVSFCSAGRGRQGSGKVSQVPVYGMIGEPARWESSSQTVGLN